MEYLLPLREWENQMEAMVEELSMLHHARALRYDTHLIKLRNIIKYIYSKINGVSNSISAAIFLLHWLSVRGIK